MGGTFLFFALLCVCGFFLFVLSRLAHDTGCIVVQFLRVKLFLLVRKQRLLTWIGGRRQMFSSHWDKRLVVVVVVVVVEKCSDIFWGWH